MKESHTPAAQSRPWRPGVVLQRGSRIGWRQHGMDRRPRTCAPKGARSGRWHKNPQVDRGDHMREART